MVHEWVMELRRPIPAVPHMPRVSQRVVSYVQNVDPVDRPCVAVAKWMIPILKFFHIQVIGE
jgi:hypothetical protein